MTSFYYSSHRILTRQGHLYVNHYGMQLTLLGRYGIKNPCGKRQGNFCFVNGDENDFRYSNLKIINPYFGVERIDKNRTEHYKVRIHIHGNITVGNYTNAIDAAIAYNKAVDLAHQAGISKNFPENYIEELSASSLCRYLPADFPFSYISFLPKKDFPQIREVSLTSFYYFWLI